MQPLIQALTYLGWGLGIAVIVYGAVRYFSAGSVPAGLISLAVIIVGPLEDILKGWVRRKTHTKEEPTVQLVDVATSAAFLLLLLLVIFMLPPR